ncbi:MAG TPA: hypothetical protein VF723_03550 [Pyrinomonadaceae bacterium]|jgi:hypothetical protein
MRKIGNSRLTSLAVILALCIFAAACNKDGGNNSNSNTANVRPNSTSTSTSSSTTTTANANVAASPSPSPATSNANIGGQSSGGGGKASSPEDAAQRLYKAWQAKDRTAAAAVASEAAVAKLFKETGGGMQFQGCNEEEGAQICGYYYEGGGLIMRVGGSASAGYQVQSVEFVVD